MERPSNLAGHEVIVQKTGLSSAITFVSGITMPLEEGRMTTLMQAGASAAATALASNVSANDAPPNSAPAVTTGVSANDAPPDRTSMNHSSVSSNDAPTLSQHTESTNDAPPNAPAVLDTGVSAIEAPTLSQNTDGNKKEARSSTAAPSLPQDNIDREYESTKATTHPENIINDAPALPGQAETVDAEDRNEAISTPTSNKGMHKRRAEQNQEESTPQKDHEVSKCDLFGL